MSGFFIDRPIFAWVIAILIMLTGVISVFLLPIAQYPTIAPITISIQTRYPGASAQTLESTVTQVIEQQMSGLDNLDYMSSSSDSSGQAQIMLTFAPGTDADVAQMQVQNKLQLAMPRLPESVQRQGLRVLKSSGTFLLVICFFSEDGSMSREDIADYLASYMQERLSRVNGVGEVFVFGSQYAMRIWIDPTKFEQFKLTPADIAAAIRAQNAQVAAGQLGALPAEPGQEISLTVTAISRMSTIEEFENILLRVNPDGSALYLKDVARIVLGAENLTNINRYNGYPASSMGVTLASDANSLETAEAVKAEVEKMSAFFPPALKHVYVSDTTPFVHASIDGVRTTLIEAIVLVFLVMWLFLHKFRATLIPAIAIPVVLLGTFTVLAIAGFSINTLTLFGLVLAIGLLVDDAIVVVENVERLMRDEGLSPREAAKKSMRQISGALIGITLVVAAVFTPMAFFRGASGAIYRQFSITLVSAMALSLVVALILTPAICASLLKPHQQDYGNRFTRAFNRLFERFRSGYLAIVQHMLAKPLRWLALYAAAFGFMFYLLGLLPTAFLPDEDQGRLNARVVLPPGASIERTIAVQQQMERYFLEDEAAAVEGIMNSSGRAAGGVTGQNLGNAMIHLKDWSERKDPELSAAAVRARAMKALSQINEGQVAVTLPPAVPELGNAAGFDFQLVDITGHSHEELMEARDELLRMARAHPGLRNVRPNGLDDVEQLHLDIDLAKAGAMSIDLADINDAISTYWGGMYVNDFMDKGRTKRVYLQADSPFRMQENDFSHYYVRNQLGEMVPFSAFMTTRSTYGSPRLERYEGLPAIQIQGEAAEGVSSGQAIQIMEELAAQLPEGFGFSWTGISFQELQSGNMAWLLYLLSMLVVFLSLAALYESWSLPFSVMLAVPLGAIGVFGGALLRGMNNDIYFQVALLTIIGLSIRNAVLIVEFAIHRVKDGENFAEAAVNAARMRLRPILMTSMAFMLGVLPLAINSGAGSGGQNAIGTGILAGMLTATFLGVYYSPLFFVTVERLFNREQAKADVAAQHGKAS